MWALTTETGVSRFKCTVWFLTTRYKATKMNKCAKGTRYYHANNYKGCQVGLKRREIPCFATLAGSVLYALWVDVFFSLAAIYNVWFGWSPFPVIVTTRIITFLVGNPYKPSFPLLLGRGTTQCMVGSIPVSALSLRAHKNFGNATTRLCAQSLVAVTNRWHHRNVGNLFISYVF